MVQKDITQIQNNLEVLIDKPLQSIARATNMVMLGFGEWVERESARIKRNFPQQNPMIMSPRYALHIQGFWRWIYSDRVVLAKNDIYEPSDSILEKGAYDPDTFEYDIFGNSRCDQIMCEKFKPLIENTENFTIKKISINRIGDVRFYFHNDFILEIGSDLSDEKECWRFFETNADLHIVVGSNEILK